MKRRLLFIVLTLALLTAAFPAACSTDNTMQVTAEPIMDNSAQVTIEPTMEYFYVGSFSEGLAIVEDDGKCGFIDETGNIVIPLKYDADRFSYFSEGLALVYTGGRYMNASQRIMQGGKCGFIDKTGRVIIPLEYDNATAFSEGLAIVEKNKKQFIIDTSGAVVATLSAYYGNEKNTHGSSNAIRPFSNGLAAVRIDDRWGYIDRTGTEVIPVGKYEFGRRDFSEELTIAGIRVDSGNGRFYTNFGFVDKTGEVVIPFDYYWLGSFSDGLATALYSDENYIMKYGVINKAGEAIIPFEYDYIGEFSEGLASFEKDGKLGYMDETENIVISLEIEPTDTWGSSQLAPFSEGLAVVYDGNRIDPNSAIMSPQSTAKYGVIDKTGKVVIPFEYDYISNFNNGFAIGFKGHADFYHYAFFGTWSILQVDASVS